MTPDVGPGGRARLAWLVAYGLVTFLAFPHPLGDTVVDLGRSMAWLSPLCLLIGLHGLGVARAARAGFVAVWLAHSAILHWIYVVSVVHGGAPPIVGVLAPIALASYVGLHGAIFAAVWAWLARRHAASPLAAAMLWVVVDHLRSFLFTGFPWAQIGYAQHESALLAPVAAWTGVYGLTFVTVLGGAAAADWILQRRARRRPSRGLVGIAIGIGLLHIVGWLAPTQRADYASPSLRVAAVQGSVEQSEKWSPERYAQTLDLYERLSRQAVSQGARLVVWPETALPGPVELDLEVADRLVALARETRAAYVIGAVGVTADPTTGAIDAYFDSAFVLDWQGRVAGRYDKSHLVPFGEYVPFRWLLGGVLDAVARGIASLDVSAGEGPRAVEVDLGPGVGRVRIGIPICYELLFPDRVRRFVDDGAQLLVAITNDAWYGRTGAPHQFLAMTALRSAETGAWTVRAANTGVSAIIDARGRVRESSRLFEPAVLVADVPLLDASGGAPHANPYARWGDVFTWGCWLGLAATLLRAARGRGRAVLEGAPGSSDPGGPRPKDRPSGE
jgi:apolipoprotein N-acyltransferase